MAYNLEFEKPLAKLASKVHALQKRENHLKPDEYRYLRQLEQELQKRTLEIYSGLTAWQTVLVARHPDRPHTIDYLRLICDDFFELHGDRLSGENPSIVGGPATLDGNTVMVIGHEKGRGRKEQQYRNAGQPHPGGFRKAHRLMQHAEKFGFPLICLIDTPGASIALEDEQRGQAQAIAANLQLMIRLRVPILAVVSGEGGSGGAFALGIADRLLMQEYSYYSVTSPESAALITFRDAKYAPDMANAMQISARQLHQLGIIDELIPEPLGGAHRNYQAAAQALKEVLLKHLILLKQYPVDELLEHRYHKFRMIEHIGRT